MNPNPYEYLRGKCQTPYQYYYNPFDYEYGEQEHAYDGQGVHSMQKYVDKQGVGLCLICKPQVKRLTGTFFDINNTGGALQDVPTDAVLVIDAHGSNQGIKTMGLDTLKQFKSLEDQQEDVPTIIPHTDKKINNETGLTPYWLAVLLEREGLNADHLAIKLVSCFGGGGANDGPTNAKPYNNRTFSATAPFAKLLAYELGQRNYYSICVAGYHGPVDNTSGSPVSVPEHTSSKDNVLVNGETKKNTHVVVQHGRRQS